MKIQLKKLGVLVLPAIFGLAAAHAQDKSAKKAPGINVSYMDLTVKPSDNFFRFVNGTWLDKTEIPKDKTRWGSFDELRQNTDKDVLVILADATKGGKYKPTSDQGKAIIGVASVDGKYLLNGSNSLKKLLQEKFTEVKYISAKNIDPKIFERDGAIGGQIGFFIAQHPKHS